MYQQQPMIYSTADLTFIRLLGAQNSAKQTKHELVLFALLTKIYRVSQKKWCIAISNSRVVLDDQRLIKLTNT